MSPGSGEISKRLLLFLIIGMVIAGGVAALGFRYATTPAVAVEGLTADDVALTTADGDLKELTMAPRVTVKWEGYRPIRTVQIRFRVAGPANNGTAITWTDKQLDNPQSSGKLEATFDTTHLLREHNGPLNASSFAVEKEGRKRERDVTVWMDVKLVAANGATVETLTPASKVTYTVAVTNQQGVVAVSGKLNTGGKCIKFNDLPETLWKNVPCKLRSG